VGGAAVWCRLSCHGAATARARVLLAASAPLSPGEILVRGRQLYSRLGLVTVYRMLASLEKMNLVRRIHRDDSCRAYLAAWPDHRYVLDLAIRHCSLPPFMALAAIEWRLAI